MTAGLRKARWRKYLIAISIVATVAAFGCWVHFRENLHVVAQHQVYRCAQPDANMLRRYQREIGIQSVINLRGYWPKEEWYQDELRAVEALGLNYYEVPLLTHRLTAMQNLRKLIQIFDECPKPVLLHCKQGADRTALAAAVYLLLYEDKTPQQALAAYRLKYGHTGWAWGHHLPHLFDCYQNWLDSERLEHSPAHFRRWADQQEIVGYFGSEIRAVPPSPVLGDPCLLTFEVTNTSQTPWLFCEDYDDGIHMIVEVVTPEGHEVVEVAAGGPPGIVEPGQTVLMQARLPKFDKPGTFILRAELVDSYGIRFGSMGSSRWTAQIEVDDSRSEFTSTDSPSDTPSGKG